MSFNYEQSIWGKGTATPNPSDPTAIRLRWSLSTLKNLPTGSKVLEVGCGAGQFIRAVKKIYPALDCYGTDISRKAIATAQLSTEGVSYILQEEKSLPFADEYFSAVLVYDVLEHVVGPEIFLKEIHRVLKPDGILYAFVPCEGDVLSFWNFLRHLGIGSTLTKTHAGHIQYFSRRSLKGMLKNSGLELQKILYSEHLLGQLLGVIAFFSLDKAAKKKGVGQLNNESYFSSQSGGFIRAIKNMVNSLVFAESVVLKKIPSPNVHIVAKKIG